MIKGIHYLMALDPETGATCLMPVKLKESATQKQEAEVDLEQAPF
jgi:hypothetical protein